MIAKTLLVAKIRGAGQHFVFLIISCEACCWQAGPFLFGLAELELLLSFC